jgi:hypothetical protein
MSLKKNLFAALLLSAAAVPAMAAVSVSIGEPGFYGSIDLGGRPPPRVYNVAPVYAGPRVVEAQPMYLRVPPGHQKHWDRNCSRYDACGRPVYFVHEDWYHQQYAARRQDERRHEEMRRREEQREQWRENHDRR